MSQPFNEAFISAHRDPLDPTHQDFDYEAVDLRLGDAEAAELVGRCEQLAPAILVLFQWLRGSRRLEPGADSLLGRRLIAALWTVNPDLFDGLSQSEIAEKLGIHKMLISRWASEFSRTFGVRNRGQQHGWNFKGKPGTSTALPPLSDVTDEHHACDQHPEEGDLE